MVKAYEEIVDFIAGGTTPGTVVAFQPSDETKLRLEDLIHRSKNATLTPDEAAELEHFLQIEHLMRLTKARARRSMIQ